MGRSTPPTGESPLMCSDCSLGCEGHEANEGCLAHGCECLLVRTRSHDALDRRWHRVRHDGQLTEDAGLLAAALRLSADQYMRDARASADTRRVAEAFIDQAIRCRIMAKAIEP